MCVSVRRRERLREREREGDLLVADDGQLVMFVMIELVELLCGLFRKRQHQPAGNHLRMCEGERDQGCALFPR